MSQRIDLLQPNPFLSSPGDYLALSVATYLRGITQWAAVFGEFIDGYLRADYDMRNLPAMRIYNDAWQLEADNWFVTGDLTVDILLPPQIRRGALQTIPDQLSGALLQQFRRTTFFSAMRTACPGLNQLGEKIRTQKNLAFSFGAEGKELCPMAQSTVNFRVDLREWDRFLESDNRTVDDPFDRTLQDLSSIGTTIQALRDDASPAVSVAIDQTV